MSRGFRITSTGFDCFEKASEAVFEAVKDAMDDIKDDVVTVTSSLAPHKTGKLEKSHYTRRSYVSLKKCTFSIRYQADNKGFDYATEMHDGSYKLGKGSQAKQPAHSRFAKGSLHVGAGYMSQVIDSSQEQWDKFVSDNATRKLKYAIGKR